MLKKVLLVDDDRDIVKTMAISLKRRFKNEIAILKAYNVKEAINIAWQERPDVMVLDYILPDGTGFNVLNIVANGVNRAVEADKVIVITGDDRSHRAFAMALGVEVYIQKPFKMSVLAAEVDKLLGKTRVPINTS